MNLNDAHRDDLEFRICRYLDGEMNDAEAAAFERQAAGSARLQAEIDAYRRLDAELGSLGGEVDVDYAAQRETIMDAVERRRLQRPSRPERWILRPMLAACAAAAMFLLALGGYWLLVGTPPAPGPHRDGDSQRSASMAIVSPAEPAQGVARTTLHRKPAAEEVRYRTETSGEGSVVVSVGSFQAAETARNGESNALGL